MDRFRDLPKPPDSLRGLPKPQRRRVHRAVMLGRPVPPHLAGVAADHARQLRSYTWVGVIWAVLGVGRLAGSAFDPHATWWSWLIAALALVAGAAFLFYGFNARRAARIYHDPSG